MFSIQQHYSKNLARAIYILNRQIYITGNLVGPGTRQHNCWHGNRQHPRLRGCVPGKEAAQAVQLLAGQSRGERPLRRPPRHAHGHALRD